MNFLQLVQRLQQECGVSGSSITTTVSQTGENKRLVDWVNSAWFDIQGIREDWQWLRTTTTFTTVAHQPFYTTAQCNATNFGRWDRDTFRNYVTSTGTTSEIFMEYIDYETWRDGYYYGALRDTLSRPFVMSISPDKSICVGPIADDGYTLLGDYFTLPVEMASDTDTPAMPSKFHMIIVYRAMMMYGYYENAQEVIARGTMEYKRLLRRVEDDRMPELVVGAALA